MIAGEGGAISHLKWSHSVSAQQPIRGPESCHQPMRDQDPVTLLPAIYLRACFVTRALSWSHLASTLRLQTRVCLMGVKHAISSLPHSSPIPELPDYFCCCSAAVIWARLSLPHFSSCIELSDVQMNARRLAGKIAKLQFNIPNLHISGLSRF